MDRKTLLASASLLALSLGSTAALADVMETYVGINARSPGDVVAAIDRFFSTDAAKGYKVFLVRSVFDGADPASHFLVSEYDSYAAYEDMVGKRYSSDAWGNAMGAVLAAGTPIRNGFGIIRADYGEGWPERDNFVMVYSINVTDSAAYAKAFDKLANSETGKKAPGITRLMENRSAGQAPTHYVVMSAPSFASLNEHLDMMFASDDYKKFSDDVEDIRTIVGTATYSKVKAWEK
ncbi:MAG: hypothetical protein JSV45_14380 [Chromatiales bacterium]|nr:MAG: hypothetical protein JSV45_14380 [Chromatiales bacterium]